MSGMVFSATVSAATPSLTFLTEPVYEEIGHLSEGVAWAIGANGICYIDENGKVVISSEKLAALVGAEYFEYAAVSDFHEGLASISLGEYGDDIVFNKSGNKVFDIAEAGTFGISSFSEGVAFGFGAVEGDVTVFGPTGTATKAPKETVPNSTIFREGLVNFYNYETDAAGYMDKNFKVVISSLSGYNSARPFNQGLAPAAKDEKWGFIDKTGKFVIEPQFDDFWVNGTDYEYKIFNEGVGGVMKDGAWGHIDMKGNALGKFEWDSPAICLNGYGAVKKGEKYGYVDTKGNTVIAPQFDDANYFTKDGVALVCTLGVYKFIDTKGNAVSSETWKFETTFIDDTNPEFVRYKKDGKWGIAKISYGGSPSSSQQVSAPSAAQPTAANDITVMFKGKALDFSDPIINVDGRTFYPLRALFTALGANTDWDQATATATGTLDDKTVKFTIGVTDYVVNDTVKSDLETAPFLNDSRTYIPIRAAAESLGFTVSWVNNTKTITIE